MNSCNLLGEKFLLNMKFSFIEMQKQKSCNNLKLTQYEDL